MNKVHLLVADSHDSFVYNLVEILRKCPNCTFDVVATEHCSSLTLENYQGILLSPGPGHPEEVKGLMPLIARTVHTHSLFGVCLGHQALALHFGGRLLQMPHPLHGHAERLSIKEIEGHTLLEQLPADSSVGRYHSWCVAEESFPNVLEITATALSDGAIMAFRHKTLPLFGVQFHPESYLSPHGASIVQNWLAGL
ncbi:anthranilate synthase component II [Porphyromonas endodontalis]|uniref:Glutamine amidotransferase, class I n=1 Tax=Porphyromonas endodontalis (strain ATCC 35406 / DSM 24491 / JCM 8526 / CCUG 16442 / BCRC 14492 / NCTC 13058 / HG 370) TaxID=553175 RepID=C3JAJ7_POREA|nr:aminodeoxychorismate/anthranilate synthase component II [Porphyromonas endodontalis]EEN82789.1 glutamine amidotransferase, class I [Porphyromonas endodontalis ATCC 35406]UBH65093.1 aminodeoxychorismate/anthranilate synthase component II [Porphyromonas endodontalis]SUB68303.1 Anthranilate synthase component II [Porphyromonas endodontalis]